MDKSAFQLLKNNARTNNNARLHNTPIISYGRVTRVIDIQTVVVETIVQTSLSKEIYTVSLLNLSSALLEISDEPKLGDTVLLLFLQRHHPRMFISETVDAPDATGYNKFSGVGILMSTAKKAASTVISCYAADGKPVMDITSYAEMSATFNSLMTIEFCRAVFDSEDEQLITVLFGVGRSLVEKHFAWMEREHGFWKDPENELIEMDASVTERYSKYAPITRNIQGAQTTSAGLETDKDGNPAETDAPITETIHGKAPVVRDIRSPQTVIVGIGNDETGDAEEQRDAPVDITLGEKADISLSSKSGMVVHFDKAVQLESDDAYNLKITGKVTVSSDDAIEIAAGTGKKIKVHNAAQSLGQILSDFIQAVHDAVTLGSPTTQAMNPVTKLMLQTLKTRCEALMEK
jgi:hypothetical protein